MRTLTEAFAPGAPSLPEGLRTLVVSPDRSVEPGTTVRATFAFYNFGGASATGLRVRFNLPDGLRYVPGSARVDDRPLDDARGETTLLAPNGADVGEVPPGVERRISLAYVVAPTIENGATLDLQAALASNETEVIGSNLARLVAVSAPELENPETIASLEAVRVAEPGEEIHVAARVHNSGHATAHDVVVVLPVPDRTAYVGGSAKIDGREVAIDERGGDPFGFGNATIASAALAAGATLVVEYRARIDTPLDDNTRIVLGGAVASTETAEFELDRAELTVRSASRFDTDATRLVVDAPNEVEPGRRVRVALVAENGGTCAADEVHVRLNLPDGLRYAPGSRAVDGRSVSESETPGSFVFARIDAGRRVEAAIDAYVVSPAVDGTPLPISGSLRWSTGSRAFERSLTVRSSPRFLDSRNILSLDGPAQVVPGGEVRATIRIANDGTAQATGVRIAIEGDPSLQSLRYADGGNEARVQPGGIDVGTLAPGAARTIALVGTVASPIADRFEIRLRARLESDQTPALPLGQLELLVRSRSRFAPGTSTLSYSAGEPLRPSGHGDVQILVVNEGTDTARDARLQVDITPDARIEAVDGATRVGTTLLFGDIAPGARIEATMRLRLARLVARGTAITINGRLEAVGLLPLALAPVTIPTIAEPRFDDGASLRTQPSETVDAGEPLYVRLALRNTGDGAASRLVVRGQLPLHSAYLPGSTLVNDVPLLDIDGGSVLWSKNALVLEDVDPGVEVVVRFGTIVNTPLAAGTLIDAHLDATWDGGGTLAISSPAVRVRSTPAFAVRATGLPFSVSGIAPRTIDVLHDIADQHRAAQVQLPPPHVAALPPPVAEPPPRPAPPKPQPPAPADRATFRYDEDAIEARFTPAPPKPPPPPPVVPPPPAAVEPVAPEPPPAPAPEPKPVAAPWPPIALELEPPFAAKPAPPPPVEPPPAAIRPEPPVAVVPEPPVPVAEPERPAAVVPEPPAAVVPEPPAAVVPEPPAAVVPEPPTAVEPEPPVAVEPESPAELVPQVAPVEAPTPPPPLAPPPVVEEAAMPDADVAAGSVAPLPTQAESIDSIAHALSAYARPRPEEEEPPVERPAAAVAPPPVAPAPPPVAAEPPPVEPEPPPVAPEPPPAHIPEPQPVVAEVSEPAVPEPMPPVPVAEIAEPVAEIAEPVAEIAEPITPEIAEPITPEIAEPIAPEPVAEIAEPVAAIVEPVAPEPAAEIAEPVAAVVEPAAPPVAPAPVEAAQPAAPVEAPPEPEREATPVPRRVRLVFAHDALERALTFLEQSDYGGLITHLFAIRTLLPTAFIGLNGDVPGKLAAEREALRGVVDRLFIKMRMPRYALTAKDVEDRASRAALIDLVRSLADASPSEENAAGDAAVVVEGPIDVARLTPHLDPLATDPLGSARPWLVLAELLPTNFVEPPGSEAMNAYRSMLISTFTNVTALPNEEFHRVLAGTQNAALDTALRDVRAALRDALEAAATRA